MALTIDMSTEYGQRVTRRLAEDQVVWLTTIGTDLTPQPSPVWFYWDGETMLIYSQPRAPKARNIRQRPRVSLNFNSTETGGNVVIFAGDAWLDDDAPAANAPEGYLAKYRSSIPDTGMSEEELAQTYSQAIRVRPTSLRGE